MARFVVEHDDSWIPDEFKEAMKDAEAGRFASLETELASMANDPQIQRELHPVNTANKR